MEESMICKILMPDRSNKAIFVHPYTTVLEALHDTASRVGLLHNGKRFGLFEYDDQQGISFILFFYIYSVYLFLQA
jgi:hypothetical protein